MRSIFAGLFFSFLMIGSTHVVLAAPQVLAVLSTGNGAALTCENGKCTASLSTYCLQKHRGAPVPGDIYHAANPTSFTLVFQMPDGSLEQQVAPTVLGYRAERSYKSVEVFMSENVIREYGAVSARLLVRPNAALIPQAEEGDPDPLSQTEIALAVGPSRLMGAKVVDETPGADTIRALAIMLRAIPEWRGWPKTTRRELWQMIDEKARREDVTGDNYQNLKSEFNLCADKYENSTFFGIGYCIRQRHDEEITRMNKEYWNSQAGS